MSPELAKILFWFEVARLQDLGSFPDKKVFSVARMLVKEYIEIGTFPEQLRYILTRNGCNLAWSNLVTETGSMPGVSNMAAEDEVIKALEDRVARLEAILRFHGLDDEDPDFYPEPERVSYNGEIENPFPGTAAGEEK